MRSLLVSNLAVLTKTAQVSSMNIPIQIITLTPNSPDVITLTEELKKQGLNVSLQYAVDGRSATPKLEPDESVPQVKPFWKRPHTLNPSEIGCYLSHLRAIKEAYKNGIQRLCLLEDDVMIEKDFSEILTHIEKLPDQFEFIRFMGLKMHSRKFIMPLGDQHQLTRPLKGLCGTQGYVINRAGMKKVLSFGSTLTDPIDKFYDDFWYHDLRCYCIEPHIIWERPSPSSICKTEAPLQHKPAKSAPLKKRLGKLCRSQKRHLYRFRNRKDFLPTVKQTTKAGKTERIH